MTTPIDDNWIVEQEAICAKFDKGPFTPTNAAGFSISARTALPLALAELRRLREICEAWRLMDAAWPARVAETPEQIRAYRRLKAALAARERGE